MGSFDVSGEDAQKALLSIFTDLLNLALPKSSDIRPIVSFATQLLNPDYAQLLRKALIDVLSKDIYGKGQIP